jgi:exodeoxyribonuclease-3
VRIVTWNVNSVRSRKYRVVAWLERHGPDVVCLQETKTVDETFPADAFSALGYQSATFGQKTYNGVAILSREEPANVRRGLPGDGPEDQKRIIAADVSGVTVVNIYVPNGSEVGSEKFAYKLDWLQRLRAYLDDAFDPTAPLVLCGDYNIAPEERDCHDAEEWRGKVLFHPDEHAALARLRDWGLVDALRLHHQEEGLYSWWDYRAAAFRRDRGMLIDHLLLTESLAARCRDVVIDKEERGGEKPSDHAPVTATFG